MSDIINALNKKYAALFDGSEKQTQMSVKLDDSSSDEPCSPKVLSSKKESKTLDADDKPAQKVVAEASPDTETALDNTDSVATAKEMAKEVEKKTDDYVTKGEDTKADESSSLIVNRRESEEPMRKKEAERKALVKLSIYALRKQAGLGAWALDNPGQAMMVNKPLIGAGALGGLLAAPKHPVLGAAAGGAALPISITVIPAIIEHLKRKRQEQARDSAQPLDETPKAAIEKKPAKKEKSASILQKVAVVRKQGGELADPTAADPADQSIDELSNGSGVGALNNPYLMDFGYQALLNPIGQGLPLGRLPSSLHHFLRKDQLKSRLKSKYGDQTPEMPVPYAHPYLTSSAMGLGGAGVGAGLGAMFSKLQGTPLKGSALVGVGGGAILGKLAAVLLHAGKKKAYLAKLKSMQGKGAPAPKKEKKPAKKEKKAAVDFMASAQMRKAGWPSATASKIENTKRINAEKGKTPAPKSPPVKPPVKGWPSASQSKVDNTKRIAEEKAVKSNALRAIAVKRAGILTTPPAMTDHLSEIVGGPKTLGYLRPSVAGAGIGAIGGGLVGALSGKKTKMRNVLRGVLAGAVAGGGSGALLAAGNPGLSKAMPLRVPTPESLVRDQQAKLLRAQGSILKEQLKSLFNPRTRAAEKR